MGIVVSGAVFVDIKGFPESKYIWDGRNVGHIEYIHGGVSRNVVENIANIELRPTFLGIVDHSGLGEEVIQKLKNHKVNVDYVQKIDQGMGTWLAVFDSNGDLAGSISQRPNLMPIMDILEEKGDEIFAEADSIAVEIDMDKELIKKMIQLAEKYDKKLYGVVSNMNIAVERRDFLKKFACVICNRLEAGVLFGEEYEEYSTEEFMDLISERVVSANIPSMVVTMGGEGAIYVTSDGDKGFCPAKKVQVIDTTGAGDAFGSGVIVGLTYGKEMREAVEIGNRLAASVITSTENVCPRFLPAEFGIKEQL